MAKDDCASPYVRQRYTEQKTIKIYTCIEFEYLQASDTFEKCKKPK